MVRPLVSVLAAAALLSESPLCRGALAAEPEVIDGIAAGRKIKRSEQCRRYHLFRGARRAGPKGKAPARPVPGRGVGHQNQGGAGRSPQGFDRPPAHRSGVQERRLPDSRSLPRPAGAGYYSRQLQWRSQHLYQNAAGPGFYSL